MTKKQKKNLLMGGLLAIVLVMGIAYASFATNLNITGSASVSSNWCIGFDSRNTSSYTATAGITGGTTPTGSITFNGDVCATNYKTTASLNASFKQPGDKVEYTLTIANKGTLPAAIESILVDNTSVTSDTTITKGNIKYIIEMPQSTSLAVDGTTTMKITAMFQNDTPVESSTTEQQTISVAINAVQDNGSGGFTPTGNTFTGTIYRNNTNLLFNGLTYNGEATVWYSPNSYSSAEEAYDDYSVYSSQIDCEDVVGSGNCTSGTITITPGSYETQASNLNKTYYLKHTIVNDIVIASYVCFVTDTEHCMQGGIDECQWDNGACTFSGTTTVYNVNKSMLQGQETWFNNHSGSCYFSSTYSECNGGGVIAYVSGDLYGYVSVSSSGNGGCEVHGRGVSLC